jgi:hypothetical protein
VVSLIAGNWLLYTQYWCASFDKTFAINRVHQALLPWLVQTGETDGPPGAVSIARAIRALGKTATIVSDEPHRIPLQALIDKENARFPELKPIALEMFPITDDLDKVAAITSDIMTRINPDHLISIERPGRAADGQYYNMRGASIAQYTSKLDELFIRAIENGIPTTCIGDGGNEIGMGNLHDQIVKYVPNGSVLATVTKCKYLISAGYVIDAI